MSHISSRNAAQAATRNRISERVLELWGNDQRCAGDKDFLTVIAAKLRFSEMAGVSTVFLPQEREADPPVLRELGGSQI